MPSGSPQQMPPRFSARRHVPHYSRLLFSALVEPIVVFLVLSGNVVLGLAATAFYRAEHGVNPAVEHPFDAVWWAFATVTTVGYGDVTPVTTAGRVIAILLMVSGISLFVGFSGFLVSIISSKATQELKHHDAVIRHRVQDVDAHMRGLSDRLDAIEREVRARREP